MVVVFHSTHYVASPVIDARCRSGSASAAEYAINLTSRLWVGVPMFFVISGYCIAASAMSHAKHERPASEFFKKRLRRIFPPYWALFGLATIFVVACRLVLGDSGAMIVPWELSPSQWFGNLTLTESWRANAFGDETRYFLGHAWTLCYEEQFYLVTGVLLFSMRKWFFAGCLLMTLAVLAIVSTTRYRLGGYFFDGYWLQFAAGLAVFYAVNVANRWQRMMVVAVLVAAFAWCAKHPGELATFRQNWEQSYATAFAFAVVLIGLHRHDELLSRLAILKPLGVAGVACYSLYLVHAPLCVVMREKFFEYGMTTPGQTLAVTLPACVAASLLVAWPFHVFIERRFMLGAKAV